jgi:hypothetical protein
MAPTKQAPLNVQQPLARKGTIDRCAANSESLRNGRGADTLSPQFPHLRGIYRSLPTLIDPRAPPPW